MTPLGASINQYGSSGVPAWSVQWYPSAVTKSGLEVIRSGHLLACNCMYTTGMVRVVWVKLISFYLQPQIHKNYNGAHIKAMIRVMLKYSHVFTLVKSPRKSQRRIFFIQDGRLCLWFPFVTAWNHVIFFNICHEKAFWCAYLCFEIQETQWNYYSNIRLDPAGENSIWLAF